MQENLQLLVGARDYFKDDLEKVGGKIYVGLYAHDFGTDDAVARAQAFADGVERNPFLSDDFPMNPGVVDVYREAAQVWRAYLQETGERPAAASDGETINPYLHMKTQLFATDAGLEILRDDEWKSIVRKMLEIREKQYLGEESAGLTPVALVEVDSTHGGVAMIARFEKYLKKHPPKDQQSAIYAFTIASMNQDRRGMLSDGEVLAVVAGYSALLSIVDLYGLAATATWVDTEDQLETVFPKPNLNARAKRLARYLQDFF